MVYCQIRDGTTTSDDTHLTSGLLQAFHQFAREVDQGGTRRADSRRQGGSQDEYLLEAVRPHELVVIAEVAVVHFGQAARPAASPRSPPGTVAGGWVYSRTAGRVYSGTASGSLRAQMARVGPAALRSVGTIIDLTFSPT